MASFRVKAYNTAHVDPQNFETVPSLDGLVDIDSVQTVSNKTFVNCTFSGADPSRLGLLMWKALFLGQFSGPGMLAVSPGLASFLQAALAAS